jgi:stage V sporulation protein G
MIEIARLHKLDSNSALKAFADVAIGQVLVKGVRIVEGKNGMFITMPQSQGKDGKWYCTVMLLDENLKEELNKTVLEAYTA